MILQVDAAVAVGRDSGLGETERESEEMERAKLESGREKERERQLEYERTESERRREVESQRELAKEVMKEGEREKERERADVSKAGVAVQRSSKIAKTENGRAQMGERAGMQYAGYWREWSDLCRWSDGVGMMIRGWLHDDAGLSG